MIIGNYNQKREREKKMLLKINWIGNIKKKLSFQNMDLLLKGWHANGSSTGTISDNESENPKIESGYALRKDMDDEVSHAYINQSFITGNAILRMKYYNPDDLQFQHISVKQKVGKIEVNWLKNVHITDTQ